jgi:hypothetical protein
MLSGMPGHALAAGSALRLLNIMQVDDQHHAGDGHLAIATACAALRRMAPCNLVRLPGQAGLGCFCNKTAVQLVLHESCDPDHYIIVSHLRLIVLNIESLSLLINQA